MNTWPSASMARRRPRRALALCALAFAVSGGLALAIGATRVSLLEGLLQPTSAAGLVVWHVRVPRALATLLGGAALAVAGALLQSVLRNPLASPNVIGVNAGAGFGVVLCLALLPACAPPIASLAAFLGALLAACLVCLTARLAGSTRLSLLLSGVALSALFTAGVDALTTLFPDALVGASQFKIGGAAGVSLRSVKPLFVLTPIGVGLACLFWRELGILSLGDETAHSLGLRPARFRALFLGLACALAASAVSVMGLIGFVGLISPHVVRFWIGEADARALPADALFGGALLTLCDLLARTLFAPFELPVGVVLSLLGAPFFLILLIRRRARD